jgi:hypothetical protein
MRTLTEETHRPCTKESVVSIGTAVALAEIVALTVFCPAGTTTLRGIVK